jgi:hypothetical protein
VVGVWRNPWGSLTQLPTGLPRAVQWLWVGLLLLLGASSLLWLLLPRLPGNGEHRRRPLALLAALLLPGSAFLDGAWGSVLLLGWASTLSLLLARLGLSARPSGQATPELTRLLAEARTPLLLTLALIYALNLLVLVLTEAAAARRDRRARRQGLEPN